jgi:predicted helicase
MPRTDQDLNDIAKIAGEQIASLKRELAEARKEHEDFVEELSHSVPESYDGDESAESIILKWAKDVDTLAGIVSRLTSSYR